MAIIIKNALTICPPDFATTDDNLDPDKVGDYLYKGFETAGYHCTTPAQALQSCRFDIYDMNAQRLTLLLETTGQPMILYRRKWGLTSVGDERSPDTDKYRGRSKSRDPISYGTNFVGGYDRYINPLRPDGMILVRMGPTEDDLESKQPGLNMRFIPSSWTLPVPVLRDRDLLIGTDEDGNIECRYEILSVTRNRLFFNKLSTQLFTMQKLNRSDPLVRDLDINAPPIQEIVDLTDAGLGDLAGDDLTDPALEAAFGDGFKDQGYSTGYNQGFTKGQADALAGLPFINVPSTLGAISSAEATYGNDYVLGYMQGYADAYAANEATPPPLRFEA